VSERERDDGCRLEPRPDKGSDASALSRMLGSRWVQTFRRSVRRMFEKRLLGEAAAVAFYALLAVFPTLGAIVSLSGAVVDIDTAARNLEGLTSVLPAGAAGTAKEVMSRIAAQGGGRAGLGMGLAAAALWSATAAALQLFGALNVAYGEVENRSLLHLCGTGLLFALGAMAFTALVLGGVLAVPVVLGAQAGVGAETDWLLHLVRWPLLIVVVAFALALSYRHGPCRACPRWQWVSWGSTAAALAWLLGSVAVSWYVEHVGSFDWLYGSVGAVLGFMLWAWVSSAAVLMGAALNAEMECQAMPGTVSTPPEN
jgi:membrane protein